MDTKIMQQFKMIPNATLAHIEGGTGWGDVFLGLFGGLSKSPILEELNGGRTKNFRACTCSPYGTGGTPNACNIC